MSSKAEAAPLPTLSSEAQIFYRDESKEYMAHAYQYGTTSHKTTAMKPAAVIYPANVDDIIAAVKHAKERGIGVAVRTGGHQYRGACSTSGDNIQLDVSGTFKSEDDYHYDVSKNLLHIGISFSLLEMNNRLREEGMFLPHGQCVHVYLGGHVLTGGYGMLTRAFGLLSDYVEGFDIVLASGDHARVWKPESEMADRDRTPETKQFDHDLYWAVLGGSPGNYGILTHVWMRPLHDADYPHSRGMKLFSVYSKKKLAKVLKVLAEMNDDDNLPRDFDVCCSVMSNLKQSHILRSRFHSTPADFKNLDQEMLAEHPLQYGYGVKWAERGSMSIPDSPLSCFVVYLQWANVLGANDKFGEHEKLWFDRIRKATSPNILDTSVKLMCDSFLAPAVLWLKNLIRDKEVLNWLYVDENEHTPLSELTRYWSWEDVREYVKPYEKRSFWSNKRDLSTNGWPDWLSQFFRNLKPEAENMHCL